MVRREVIELVDDLDGGPAVGTVSFSVDGVSYEIDLNQANQDQLRESLQRWTDSGRAIGRTRRRAAGAAPASRSGGPSAAEIRSWAAENDVEVNSHGRVPQDVRDAYEAAH